MKTMYTERNRTRYVPENKEDIKKLEMLHIYEKKARAIRKLMLSSQSIIDTTGKEQTGGQNE